MARMTPAQRAALIDCLNRGAPVSEMIAATGLPPQTIWHFRHKHNEGMIPETRGGGPSHRYGKKSRHAVKPNVVAGVSMEQLMGGSSLARPRAWYGFNREA